MLCSLPQTFTGNFVYHVLSVLPDVVVKTLLKEVGYVATTATEFSLLKKPNEEEAAQVAFEMFLARLECEEILEMTKDIKESDWGDILQKRGQMHWYREDSQLAQREAYTIKRESNEVQDSICLPQALRTHSKFSFEKVDSGLRDELELTQPVASELTREHSVSQNPTDASTHSCVKSSDSEDFLTKYSDIVIGQKPLHLADFSPKASEDQTWDVGHAGPIVGLPTSGTQVLTFLSPGKNSHSAGTLEGRLDHRTQESSKTTPESKVSVATTYLGVQGTGAADHPKELKGDTVPCGSNLTAVCSLCRKEETHALASTFNKQKVQEDYGGLMYPVEETAQPESLTSNTFIKEFNPSRLKLLDLPGEDKEGFSVDLYSSDRFCNRAGRACPAVGSDMNRFPVGLSGASGAQDCFKYARERPSSTRIILPTSSKSTDVVTVTTRCVQCRRNLEAFSLTDVGCDTCYVNETSPEDFVIVSKDD